MKRHFHPRQLFVQSRVDVERGRFRLPFAVHDIAVKVADQQVVSGDFCERVAIGVHEKQIIPARHHGGKVVADALLQSVQRRQLKARCQFRASGDGGLRIEIQIGVTRGTGTACKGVCHDDDSVFTSQGM